MKKLIKYFLISSLLMGLMATVWFEYIASDETKIQMEFESIETAVTEAESFADLTAAYDKLSELAKVDSLGFCSKKIDSLISAKTTHNKRVEVKEINKQRIGAYLMSKQFVTARLKAPTTAKFPAYHEDGVFVDYNSKSKMASVQLFVDAQNSFGAMIRTNFSITLENIGGGKWKLVKINKI